MSSPALPLTPIVNFTVIAAPPAATPPQYNQGLIVSNTQLIPYATRLLQFTSLNAMLAYGFTSSDPEYIQAALYFGQVPQPQYVWIGLQCTTSLKTVNPHSGSAGTGYAAGDVVLVVQSGGSLGFAQVATIGAGGAVDSLTIPYQTGGYGDGTGYSVANGLATTAQGASVGTGLEVDITAIGETPLTAFTNCRLANTTWYDGVVTTAVTADHEAIFLYAQSATPLTFYYALTSDAAVLNLTSGNIAATLKAANYNRGALIYSTTQGGAAPNNVAAASALMGSVNGQNTGLPNSYFTEWGKILIGITPEPLTQTQIGIQSQGTGINGLNCNVFVGYIGPYTIVQPGITPSGVWIDQQLNRDILTAACQIAVMNLLYDSSAVPQTDPGEQELIHALNAFACTPAVQSGYLAPGTYQGEQPVVNLQPGDPMPAGFVIQAYPYSTQSPAAKQARQSMPLYIVANEAGAVQSVVGQIIINP
jgi:uncharacterized protein DUF3383